MNTLKKVIKISIQRQFFLIKAKKQKKEKFWSKIRDLINSISRKSDDYDEKHMKIKFNLNDELPLNKTIEIHSLIIVVRVVFQENKKDYAHVF